MKAFLPHPKKAHSKLEAEFMTLGDRCSLLMGTTIVFGCRTCLLAVEVYIISFLITCTVMCIYDLLNCLKHCQLALCAMPD